jgi:hypothetical protein
MFGGTLQKTAMILPISAGPTLGDNGSRTKDGTKHMLMYFNIKPPCRWLSVEVQLRRR